jgi:hypothetical protein
MPHQLPCALAAAPMAIYKGAQTKCIGSLSETDREARKVARNRISDFPQMIIALRHLT